MERELKILLQNSYLSRRDYRHMRAKLTGLNSLDELRTALIEAGTIEPPDWREAEPLLVGGTESLDQAPESVNHAMLELTSQAMRISLSDTTVLILGESGVGKSRLSRRIHLASPRCRLPFVTFSCGSVPESLIESELFGVEKGAYTGAIRSRDGRFSKAAGGTLFLDEIGELPPALQVKLLRAIQEKTIEPLGSDQELRVDVRLITATNRNLEKDVESGRFREDLFFRLNVVPLTIPPLRERREDIPMLTRFFIERQSRKLLSNFTIEDRLLEEILVRYPWPGNIRELENCIERLCVLSTAEQLSHTSLPPRILRHSDHLLSKKGRRSGEAQIAVGGDDGIDAIEKLFGQPLAVVEREQISFVLRETGHNLQQCAALLGIHRNTLRRKLRDYRIQSD